MVAELRAVVRKILTERSVDIVIGFQDRGEPLRAPPVFITNPAESDSLVVNPFCENNLAVYLKKLNGKRVGILARGCESRAINILILEHQWRRENLFIIGIPCPGVLDRKLIVKELDEEIVGTTITGDTLTIYGSRERRTLPFESYEHISCQTCEARNPVVYDVLVGEPGSRTNEGRYPDVTEFEQRQSRERFRLFKHESARCIRCYACREACPLCYCTECFVDSSSPRWLEPGTEVSDLVVWQLLRAFHGAGRCVDCGACARACPLDLNLFHLSRKINKDLGALFNFKAGMDDKTPPALATYNPNDPEDSIQ